MWRRLRALRGRRTRTRSISSRRLSAESLETRAMFAATPVGSEFFVAPTSSSDSDRDAGQVIFGSDGETLTVSHSAEVVGARVAGNDEEIFVRRFDRDDNQIGTAILANQITRGDQLDPVIGAAADGSFLVVWSGRGEGDRQGIFARRFEADGTAIGDQFRVNTTTGGNQAQPDVAVSSDGTAVVTWHGVGAGDTAGVFAQRIGSDGTLLGDETLVNTVTTGQQGYASVSMDSVGNYVIAWSSRHQDGDDWGIFAQRFNSDGSTLGDEFAVNTTTTGSQHHADVDVTPDGRFTIAWSSFGQDGDSWGVFSQQFAADGSTAGPEFQVNEDSSGHQLDANVAVSDGGDLVVAWTNGVADGSGWEVNARTFDSEGNADGEVVLVNQANNGAGSGHQRNPSVALDVDGSSIILFQGNSLTDRSSVQQQRFEVDVEPVENQRPVLAPIDPPEEIRVGETLEVVFTATDPNSGDMLTFEIEENPDTPEDAELVNVTENQATLRWTPTAEDRGDRVTFRVLVMDDGDPQLADAAQFLLDVVNSPPALDLNGGSAGTNRQVTLSEGASEVGLLNSDLTLTDADQSEMSGATAALRSFPNLTDESLSVDTTGTNITATYTAALGRLELTGADSIENYRAVLETLRYTNTSGAISGDERVVEVTVNDGTDDSNEALITIQIGDNTAPELPAFDPITVLAGSPLHIPLNGLDADGDTLTYTAVSDDPSLLTPTVLEGNQSWRLEIEGTGSNSDLQGEMVFELFEQRAPRATEQFIELTNDDFFNGIIFHRVINGFVIQGGDPTGTGTGGSPLGDFDDQYHVDLQHNRTGILSMAKSLDDTNDSQFFVTEGATRTLDFQHTIFGLLVEGEDVREDISNVTTGASDRPLDDVVIANAEIFVDTQNGVLMLEAPEGASGTVSVDVTVSDGNGGMTVRTITIEVVPDTVNGQPFLNDIPTITTSVDTPASFQLSAQDVEGDPVFFFDEERLSSVGQPVFAPSHPDLDYSVDPNTGLLTITPTNGLTGTHEITVAAASTLTPGSNIDFQVIDVVING